VNLSKKLSLPFSEQEEESIFGMRDGDELKSMARVEAQVEIMCSHYWAGASHYLQRFCGNLVCSVIVPTHRKFILRKLFPVPMGFYMISVLHPQSSAFLINNKRLSNLFDSPFLFWHFYIHTAKHYFDIQIILVKPKLLL
jgi:hypothetical protein